MSRAVHSQPRAFQHLRQGAKAQRDAEDGEGFGQRGGDVIGGEGAERRQQQRDPAGAWPADLRRQAGNEQAGAEVDERLQVQHGVIVCHAEDSKAEGQKCRVAGQAHQCGLNGGQARCVAHGVAVDAVGEPVGGNVSVEQRIALDLRVGVNQPQAQSGSGCEHKQGEQPWLKPRKSACISIPQAASDSSRGGTLDPDTRVRVQETRISPDFARCGIPRLARWPAKALDVVRCIHISRTSEYGASGSVAGTRSSNLFPEGCHGRSCRASSCKLSAGMNRQIFFDPQRKRWKRLRRILDAVAVFSTVILVLFFLNVVKNQQLPELLLPTPKRNYRAIQEQAAAIKAKYSEAGAAQDQPQAFGDSLQLRRRPARCLLRR